MIGKNNNRSAVRIADMEPDIVDAPLSAEKAPRPHPRACIHIHSYRRRLADADAVSGKAAIDGIVKAGILPDDSPAFLEQVSYSQEKAKEDKTVITISFLPNKP